MRTRFFIVLLFVALLAAACGGQAQETAQEVAPTLAAAVEEVATEVAAQPTTAPAAQATEPPMEEATHSGGMVTLPAADPLAVSGPIITAGSSTVFPLSERMAERYQDEGFAGQITIDSIGSGAGYERFCVAGETDIANASRAIREEEVASCEAIGRTPIEFRVGTDALAVVVSNDNDFLEDATLAELALIFSTAELWSDVNPAYPAEPIQRFIPGTDSGTYDYFSEEVFPDLEEGQVNPQLEASNLQQSEDDNVLVQGVSGSPYAVGYFGYAYAAENADVVRPINLEGVEPTFDAVEGGEYPLARPLFIYSDATIMQDKPQVADFINFYLTYVNDEIQDVGYFPASDAALDESKTKWLVAMGLAEGEAMEETSSGETMDEAAMGVMPAADPLAVSGPIITAGSSTVFPLSERMAERYQDEGFAGQITIDSIGSGAGYERFCVAGETDIANASRAIREEEVASCEAIGRTPIEFRVGTDALAVVVSTSNDFLEDATLAELALIFSTAELWSDVNPAYPAEPIQRFIPGTDSGTYDYFSEEIFPDVEEGQVNPQLEAANLQQSEDDNVLVQGVSGSPYAIGYFGYAYAAENADVVRPINLEGVEPTFDAVEGGEYPLARPLFIYSDATIMQDKPQVADFINFYLTYVNDEIISVGYFPASDAALEESRMKWMVAMGLAEASDMSDMAGETGEICELPAADPLAVSGPIITAGSSTVFPLSERMAERYQDEGFSSQITIDSIGSGAGFERFCVAGETDIANASRAIREEEVASCEAIGRTPIEFRVGTDALAVVVSTSNDFLQDATLEELALIFSTAELWSDVNPAYPAEPIQRFIPGTDSGTYDYFSEEVFPDLEDGQVNPQLEASGLQQSEDDNVLVQGISGSPYAVGYFGYAYAAENTDVVRPIALEGVEPSAQTVDAGEYPLARPLFIYSDATIMQDKPQVADFINFYLTYVNDEIISVGYFPASDAALNSSRCLWVDAMGQ